jgi:hypothetical protein
MNMLTHVIIQINCLSLVNNNTIIKFCYYQSDIIYICFLGKMIYLNVGLR